MEIFDQYECSDYILNIRHIRTPRVSEPEKSDIYLCCDSIFKFFYNQCSGFRVSHPMKNLYDETDNNFIDFVCDSFALKVIVDTFQLCDYVPCDPCFDEDEVIEKWMQFIFIGLVTMKRPLCKREKKLMAKVIMDYEKTLENNS